jgi:hypothetical protein
MIVSMLMVLQCIEGCSDPEAVDRFTCDAGLVGRRVKDATALYDAVATMDTVTLIRSTIRGIVKIAGR